MSQHAYTFLHLDIPLTDYFSTIWGIPVFIENDTHLMALGENYYGLAKDLTNVISVNLSKGLAVSVISNGQLQTGHSGFAGEVGHIFAENNNKLRETESKTESNSQNSNIRQLQIQRQKQKKTFVVASRSVACILIFFFF